MVSTCCVFDRHQVMCVCHKQCAPAFPTVPAATPALMALLMAHVRLSATAPVGPLQGSVVSLHNKDTMDHSPHCELPDFCACWQAFRFLVESSQRLQHLCMAA